MKRQLSRRKFLRAAAMAGLGLGTLGAAGCAGETRQRWLRNRLLKGESCDECAQRIGLAYLQQHPEEQDETRLSWLLVEAVEARAGRAWFWTQQGLLDALAAVCSQEFEEEQVVLLERWVLARTEARLCALYHLSQRAPR